MSDGRCPKCFATMMTSGCPHCSGGVTIFEATRLPLSVQEAASLGEIATLRAALSAATERAAKAEGESESRRRILIEKGEEARREWTRAENAEARAEAAESAASEDRKALGVLSMGLGNPCLEAPGDTTLSDALVAFALARLSEEASAAAEARAQRDALRVLLAKIRPELWGTRAALGYEIDAALAPGWRGDKS